MSSPRTGLVERLLPLRHRGLARGDPARRLDVPEGRSAEALSERGQSLPDRAPIRGNDPWCSWAVIMSLGAVAAAADVQPPPVQAALDHLRAANAARTAVAGESAAWVAERQRLEALISATEAESARLIREAEAAERERDAAAVRLAALGRGSDLDDLRLRLGEAGQSMATALSELARRLPPGAVPTPAASSGEDGFDAAVRSLDAAERAAGSVAVEVVTGVRDGMPAAVKMLRVAGAAAWWVSLDGAAAGTVAMVDGTVRLTASDEVCRPVITAALLQAEGRGQPGVVLLPGAAP